MGGIFCTDYARAFATAGAKVGVVFPDLVSVRYWRGGTTIPWRPRLSHEDVAGVPVIRIRGLHTAFGSPGLQMYRYRRWLRWGLRAYQARHGEPAVLHAMCAIPAGWACTHLGSRWARRVVVTEHTGPFSLVMRPRAGERYVRAGLAKAAAVVAVSETLRAEMRDAGIDGKIDVCGNPVAESFQAPAAPRDGLEGRPRALFVGRLAVEKGLSELIEAAVLLEGSREVDWHFAGDGPMASEVRARFATAGLRDRLHMHGTCDRATVAGLMSASDLLVLPTHGETFGMVVAEALCMGLPVVTTRGTACGGFVGEGDGVLVEAGDAGSLAAGLCALIGRIGEYDRAAIADRAWRRFSGRAVVSWYTDVFRRVMA